MASLGSSFERRQVGPVRVRLDIPPTLRSLPLSVLPISSSTVQPSYPGSPISSVSSSDRSTSSGVTSSMTTLPGSISSTSTSSSASSPTSTASFAFNGVPDVATCTQNTISWNYVGSNETFTMYALASVSPHTDATGRRDVAQLQIAAGLDSAAQQWIWPAVNVSSGWWILQAIGTDFDVSSSQFFIYGGTDTSCLSSSSSSTSPTTAPTTGTSLIATSTSTSSTTSSGTTLPVSAATSNRSRTGAIAGGVIGGVFILAAAIAGYIYFGLCRRTPTRSRRPPGQLGKWGGLSSRDSGMDAPMAARPTLAMAVPTKKRGTVESTGSGAMLSPTSSSAHGHSGAARGVSDEDLATLAGEEKVAYGTKGYEYVETVPPFGYNNRRRSSASTSGLSPIASIPEPPPSAGSMGRSRARSSSQSHRAMTLAKLDGNDSVPASPRVRSPTVPRRSIDGAPPMAMPSSPPYDVSSPMNRSSSGGGPGARRGARKPVPQLDAADVSSPSTPTLSPGANVSRGQSVSSTVTAASTPAPSPGPYAHAQAHPMYRNESQSSGTLRPFVTARHPSREDLEASGVELPSLNHKSSFGDRQVHYLIPDMPPPPPRG